MTSGQALIQSLGLDNFIYITIQKLLNFGLPAYVVTVDSRHPTAYISYAKLVKMKSAVIKAVTSSKPNNSSSGAFIRTKKIKLTPPMDLDTYDRIIPTRALIFMRDLGGDYFINKKLYEKIEEYNVRII